MTVEERYNLSCYKEISKLNNSGTAVLTRHMENGKIAVKKTLSVYNTDVYKALFNIKKTNKYLSIPEIYDIFEDEGTLYITESYIEGQTLKELLDEKHILGEQETIKYITSLCDILHTLHNQIPPIIHRDIKPSNIIIDPDNTLHLIDFNTAKHVSYNRSSDTVLLGTKGYAAPEQYGFGPSTPQTDIYALGVLINVMLTGHYPNEMIYTGVLKGIIEKCTSMDAAARYLNVSELKEALQKIPAGHDIVGLHKRSEGKLNALHKISITVLGFIVLCYLLFFSGRIEEIGSETEQLFFTLFWLSIYLISAIYWCDFLKIKSRLTRNIDPSRRGVISFFIYLIILLVISIIIVVPYVLIEGAIR